MTKPYSRAQLLGRHPGEESQRQTLSSYAKRYDCTTSKTGGVRKSHSTAMPETGPYNQLAGSRYSELQPAHGKLKLAVAATLYRYNWCKDRIRHPEAELCRGAASSTFCRPCIREQGRRWRRAHQLEPKQLTSLVRYQTWREAPPIASRCALVPLCPCKKDPGKLRQSRTAQPLPGSQTKQTCQRMRSRSAGAHIVPRAQHYITRTT